MKSASSKANNGNNGSRTAAVKGSVSSANSNGIGSTAAGHSNGSGQTGSLSASNGSSGHGQGK